MIKTNYQKPECIVFAFEKEDVVTLSLSDGTSFNAQDYGWWTSDNFTGGTEK